MPSAVDPPGVIGAELVRAAPVRKRFPRRDAPPPVAPGKLTFLAVDPGQEYASRARTPPRCANTPARRVASRPTKCYDASTRAARRCRLPLTARGERSSRPRSDLLRPVKGGAKRPARRWGRNDAREAGVLRYD